MRAGTGGTGLQLGDDVHGSLNITRRTGDHDTLTARFYRDVGCGHLLAIGQRLGEGLSEDLTHVLCFRGAGPEHAGNLDDLCLARCAGGRGTARTVDGLVEPVDEGLDLVGHAGQRSRDDESVSIFFGDDPGLGGGCRSRFVGGSYSGDRLSDHVGQIFGLNYLGGVNSDIARTGSAVFKTGDEFIGQAQPLTGTKENQRSGSVIVHGRDVVVRIGGQDVELLRGGIELGALRSRGDTEGAVDEVGNNGPGGMKQRVGLHLPLSGRLIVDRTNE